MVGQHCDGSFSVNIHIKDTIEAVAQLSTRSMETIRNMQTFAMSCPIPKRTTSSSPHVINTYENNFSQHTNTWKQTFAMSCPIPKRTKTLSCTQYIREQLLATYEHLETNSVGIRHGKRPVCNLPLFE